MTRLLVALLALTAGFLAFGDATAMHPGRSFQTTAEPAAPTEADIVTILVSGALPHPCFDISSSHTRNGELISITVVGAENAEVCVTMVSEFNVAEVIGQLPAGDYTAEVFLDIPCC